MPLSPSFRLACCLAASWLVLASKPVVSAPPPIPSAEARARLLAEHAVPTVGRAAELRAVHDEYDVLHYDITLSMDIPAHVLFGTVVFTATPTVANLTEMRIDLFDNMAIDAVRVDGFPRMFSRLDDVVTVQLGGARQPGDNIALLITYHGTPAFPGSPLPFRWQTHGGVAMILSYSEPFGGPAWWAQKDDPKDKATFALHFKVPSTLSAVSNGLLESAVNNGDGTTTYNWRTNYLMSPYLFSIAVTNFQSWTEVYTALDATTTMNVTYWAYPEDLATAQASWGRNMEMMEYFASIFGEYPFLAEKYGIAEFQHPGAMEHQTCTSMGRTWLSGDDTNDFVVAHELSHSWVGDLITMREWSHAWTKEGFATYCEALYFENKFGTAYYHDYMAGMNVMNYAADQIYNPANPVDSAIYYKGAWVLHMLRHVLGDATFFDAIHAYAEDDRFRYGVADTDDLRGVFEAVSGLDLVQFFDQWVYNPGYPIYEVDWSAAPVAGTGYQLTLSIDQVHTLGPTFRMPIDVAIATSTGTERFVVGDSLASQTFVLTTSGAPQGLTIDPDAWLLCEVHDLVAVGDPASFFLLRTRSLPNPFQGTGTWIDYELPAAGRVRLDVYDLAGRTVRTLLDAAASGGHGRVRWDGTDATGREAAPGVYYYRLRTEVGEATRRLVLVR